MRRPCHHEAAVRARRHARIPLHPDDRFVDPELGTLRRPVSGITLEVDPAAVGVLLIRLPRDHESATGERGDLRLDLIVICPAVYAELRAERRPVCGKSPSTNSGTVRIRSAPHHDVAPTEKSGDRRLEHGDADVDERGRSTHRVADGVITLGKYAGIAGAVFPVVRSLLRELGEKRNDVTAVAQRSDGGLILDPAVDGIDADFAAEGNARGIERLRIHATAFIQRRHLKAIVFVQRFPRNDETAAIETRDHELVLIRRRRRIDGNGTADSGAIRIVALREYATHVTVTSFGAPRDDVAAVRERRGHTARPRIRGIADLGDRLRDVPRRRIDEVRDLECEIRRRRSTVVRPSR